MKKIFFRADADKYIGYGHFIRTLALAEMLKDDFECVFFTQEPTEFQKNEVSKICKLVSLPANDSKFDIFLSYLTGEEIVFLDNYFFTSEYQKKIKNIGCKLICLGTNDRHYYSDILFNFAEKDPAIFSAEPYTQINLGVDWTILRKPFRNRLFSAERRLNSIIICFGGTDQLGLTEKTIEAIRDVNNNVDISLIATDAFGDDRFETLRKEGIKCHVNAEDGQIAELLRGAKCMVASASTIACEALACGTTVLCGYYVDNQIKMYEYLISEKLVLGLSDLRSYDAYEKLKEYISSIDIISRGLNKKEFSDLQSRYLSLFKKL